jgi:hypothetical protein
MAKDPNDMTHIVKTYGPGFVAQSKESGRVVAHADDFEKLMKQIEHRESYKKDKLVIMHVPSYYIRSVY